MSCQIALGPKLVLLISAGPKNFFKFFLWNVLCRTWAEFLELNF